MKNPSFDGYKNKLISRLYGLLCEREKNGEWKKFLEGIIIELSGLNLRETINCWGLVGKLESLKYLSYEYFRRTIFECIQLVNTLEENDELL